MIYSEIIQFIKECKVATVCTSNNNVPYCFNCYFSFLEKEGVLIYKSSFGTKHEEMMLNNKLVAGTIIPENIELSLIRGIQFEGNLLEESMEMSFKASTAYYLQYPFAFGFPGKIYVIEINKMKFTDNTKGFGHKQHWQRK